ncbi:hypothetical protein ACHHYP_20719 [Achlya hypogyna]|uniref:Uncharacterized protein n=1 Tax=Achlya hypogyna TaxID=1202772 RepID=A0A1V9YDN5_ACHHY|nr:hypothetical protein ACHHYP_20719 [Achlya hypogyna]
MDRSRATSATLSLQAPHVAPSSTSSSPAKHTLLWTTAPTVHDKLSDSCLKPQHHEVSCDDIDEARVLSALIESTSATLLTESAELFGHLQRRLVRKHEEDLSFQKNVHTQELQKLQACLGVTSSQHQALELTIDRQDAVLNRLAIELHRRTNAAWEYWSSPQSLSKCLFAWRSWWQLQKSKRLKLRRAIQFHTAVRHNAHPSAFADTSCSAYLGAPSSFGVDMRNFKCKAGLCTITRTRMHRKSRHCAHGTPPSWTRFALHGETRTELRP